MNEQERKKFDEAISNGYKQLITQRPGKPLEHFIYYILSTLPEDMINRDEQLSQFYTNYKENDLRSIKDI